MREIKLRQGFVALVDDEDFERINKFKWFAKITNTGPSTQHISAARWGPGTYPNRDCIQMSYEVMRLTPAQIKPNKLDHKNRNPLDNQKHNLGIVTHQQNAANSARVINAKGVYYEARRNKWKAFLTNGNSKERKYLGTYKTECEALQSVARARQEIQL